MCSKVLQVTILNTELYEVQMASVLGWYRESDVVCDFVANLFDFVFGGQLCRKWLTSFELV